VTEEVIPVDGVLLGVLPEARKFELRLPGDDAARMEGAVSEDLAIKYTSDAGTVRDFVSGAIVTLQEGAHGHQEGHIGSASGWA
jgi:hypothetical protein